MSPFMVDHVQLYLVYSSHQGTPLRFATREGHVDIVRYLVDKDADPNIKDKDGVSDQEYTADCKLVLLVRVGFHSPEGRDTSIDRIAVIISVPCLVKQN